MPKLRQCPFCGEDAYISNDDDVMYTVYCMGCKVELGYFDSEEEAIAAWNRRVIILD